MSKEHFIQAIRQSYTFKNPSVYLGGGVYNDEIVADAKVNLSLGMMTRHGLVTGATGSGKTRTLQLIAEQLSAAGVPVFMPDIKGDISGLAREGDRNARIDERAAALGINYRPAG